MIFDFFKPDLFLENIKIKNKSKTSLKPKIFGFIEFDKYYQIFANNSLYKIEILSNIDDIDSYIKTKQYKAIIYIKELLNNFYLCDIYFFPFYKEISSFNIEIENKVFENLKNRNLSKSLDEISKKLKEKTLLKINDFSYYIIATYSDSGELDSFILFCEDLILSVKKTKVNDKIFFTTSKLLSKIPQNINNFILIKGNLDFKSGLVEDKIANDLENIIKKDNSYIKAWNEYLDIEGDILLKKARDIGVIQVNKIVQHLKSIELICENTNNLSINDSIGFFEEIPSYLKENFSFSEFLALLEKEFKENKIQKELFFQIKDIKENSIFIENSINSKELESKIVAFSLLGDKVQIARKLSARELIIKGKSANPFLGLIIEGGESLKNYQKPKKSFIEPLSKYVKEKIFKKEPTKNQIEAINIALNTPDIAIIQGPPGTGKTTVITAIIERLNEIKEKDNLIGEILIAGYQHDAVINLTQRLNVNSLPAVKFGIKDDDEVLDRYDYIQKWANNILSKIKVDSFSKQEQIDNLDRYIKIYSKTPTNEIALKILDNLVGFGLDNEVEKIKSNIKDEDIFDIKELKVLYALRVSKEAFLDDGKERIDDLLNSRFINILDKNEIEKLEKKDINFLDEYRKIKVKLIKIFYPKPKYQKPKPNEELLNLIEKIKDKLKDGKTKKDQINKILYEYQNTLKNNPFVLEETIKEYSFVFGSTTQQSSHKDMVELKDEEFFDTVIIDEAGRVPPMDLFIPMVRAKKRIILVGDHRQLPHMVDEAVIDKLEENSNIENDYIQKSMFEYLKNIAKKLETQDGIKRTITLNNQYRTNPIMGKFINDNFYEKYSVDEKFHSPRPINEFSHNLEYIENKPCVWIDVKDCYEESGKSKSRICEAKEIVKYLKIWLNGNGKDLEYGIITFYKKQVEIIKELLQKELPKFASKIKVGSVDAFQGMEFDVVFLSTVRSKKYSYKPKSDFGFLVSKNRLNVSMSRQKKVLVVVGDKDYFYNDYAKKHVEELYNYIELCKKEGIIL